MELNNKIPYSWVTSKYSTWLPQCRFLNFPTFPWQIKTFPRPISLTSSNNGLKPTHIAILSTHKFMLSACYKQWTWTGSSFRQRRNMTEFVVQFHSIILWWSNTSHVHEICGISEMSEKMKIKIKSTISFTNHINYKLAWKKERICWSGIFQPC